MSRELLLRAVESNPCDMADPQVVARDTGVDAVLALSGALLPPADDTRQEPSTLVLGDVWTSAVPLARVLQLAMVARAEHKARDVVPAAAFTLRAVDVGDLELLQLGGLWTYELESAPTADQRGPGVPQQGLYEVLGAQADRTAAVGQLHGAAEPQQGDVVVVLGFVAVVAGVDELVFHRVIPLCALCLSHVMFTLIEG